MTLSQLFNGLGGPSLIALYLNYFCMSIMFPTIFALGLKDLGGMTKKGSSVLVMTVVGGAACPVIMGRIADVSGMATGTKECRSSGGRSNVGKGIRKVYS